MIPDNIYGYLLIIYGIDQAKTVSVTINIELVIVYLYDDSI